jgi:NADH dehydrogenase [ubiquinone] 1 alpha subcomplex assembly factor 7
MTDTNAEPKRPPILDHLGRLIDAAGAISVADYIATALGHPEYGYYATRDPFGRSGDFITAPEISQAFGELLGLWAAQMWMDMGCPEDPYVVELGPGRGTLMADALRALDVVPAFRDRLRIAMVETSPVLRAKQEDALAGTHAAQWHESLDQALSAVPNGPVFFIANEFFDALPVHQFVRTEMGWRERLVTMASETELGLALGGDPEPALATALPDPAPLPEGTVVERSPMAEAIAAELGTAIAERGGGAAIIDYGYDRTAPGETLQAVRRHAPCGLLEHPGEAVITAHVDFERLGAAAKASGCRVLGPVDQGVFLKALGIEARVGVLTASADAETVEVLRSGLERLTAGDQMGTLFRAMGIASPGGPDPAGFDVPDQGFGRRSMS